MQRLGDILIGKGLISAEQLEGLLDEQSLNRPSARLGELLIEQALIENDQLLAALAEQFGCQHVQTVTDEMLDPELVQQLPLEWVKAKEMLPIRWGAEVGVLTSDPSNLYDIADLAVVLGADPVPLLASSEVISNSIQRCYFSREGTAQDFINELESEPVTIDGSRMSHVAPQDLLSGNEQAPVTQLVNLILLEAVKRKVSDVHIEPYQKTLRIRYRIDGVLYDQTSPPKHMEAALVSRLKVMAHLDIAEKRLPQDGVARVQVGERDIDIRVSIIPVAQGERVVLRLLYRESATLPLSSLGMTERFLNLFRKILDEPHGVVWVTGPTGSGKTTTLYAALQELDTLHRNILTIEDPVEYELPNIGQIGVKPKIGLTFSAGLRHILRQDPDVVLVGETRDRETAEIVVQASMTGHLVFSTLHTNDALSVFPRLVDMGVEPYLVTSATRAALAQRLVRCVCTQCRYERALTPEEQTWLASFGIADALTHTVVAEGCTACMDGYVGRTGIYELVHMSETLQELIRSQSTALAYRKQALSDGMITLLEDGLDKVKNGSTSLHELMRIIGPAVAGQGI